MHWCRWLGCLGVPLACAAPAVPDPRLALDEYRAAVQRADAAAVHALLDEKTRAAVSVQDVKRWLAQSGPELARRATEWSQPSTDVVTRAQVRYVDGEMATLTLEPAGFRVEAAGALPAAARSPEQALGELRRALAGRNYPALLRVLTPEGALQLDSQLSSLVRALEQPAALPIQVDGNRATLITQDGHRVELEQADGVWRVRDFE